MRVPMPDPWGRPLGKWWDNNLSFEALSRTDEKEIDTILGQRQDQREAAMTDEELEGELVRLTNNGEEVGYEPDEDLIYDEADMMDDRAKAILRHEKFGDPL